MYVFKYLFEILINFKNLFLARYAIQIGANNIVSTFNTLLLMN